MGYATQEISTYQGQPIECYVFQLGSSTWRYTSAEDTITLPGWPGSFTPAAIASERQVHGSEDRSGGLTITAPPDLPCLGDFVFYSPESRLSLTLIQAHRTDLSDAKTPFRGSVVNVGWEDGKAKLSCMPITHEFGRLIRRFSYQRQCNWPLYSGGCGVALGIHEATVTVQSIAGNVISGVGFGYLSDNIYRAGFILWASQRRFIMEKSGQDVTLMSPFAGLTPGQQVNIYAGCDGTEAVCAGTFSNLDKHLGFARVPYRNPHTRRAF